MKKIKKLLIVLLLLTGSAAATLSGASAAPASAAGSVSASVISTGNGGSVVVLYGNDSGWYRAAGFGATDYISKALPTLSSGAAPISPLPAKPAEAEAVPADIAPVLPIGQQLADFALQFDGYSYVYGGSSPESGFDCSGLTSYVYRQFGYTISRTASQQFKNNGTPVQKADLQPGDLVFFSSDGAGVTHVGLYIGSGKFVNASNDRTGVIVSSLSSSWYTKTWWGAKRLVG